MRPSGEHGQRTLGALFIFGLFFLPMAFSIPVPGTYRVQLVSAAPLQAANNSTPARYDVGFNMTEYHSYDQITGMLQNITADHPEITRLYSLGRTYEGRDLWALKLSDHPDVAEDDEPEVLYVGLHHAREWSSVEVVMYFLHWLVNLYGLPPTDNDGDGLVDEDTFNGIDDDGDGLVDEDEYEARASWLVNNRQLWFIPVFNPDGLEMCRQQYYVQGITDENVLWRKNREPNLNPLTGEPLPEYVAGQPMWGTDLNRNYGWHWGEVGYQGYVDPSREDYAGPWDKKDDDGDFRIDEDNMDAVDNDGDGKVDEDVRGGFTTMETKAIRDLVEEHYFTIIMSYHTYKVQGTIYWPSMYTRQLPPDEQLFKHLAEGIYVYNGYEYRNYTEQDTHRKGPLVDGDLNDWAYGELGILSYAIELRQPQFIANPDLLPQLEGENLGGNLYLAETADEVWGNKLVIDHEPLKDTDDENGPYVVNVKLNWTSRNGLIPPELRPHGLMLRYSIDGGRTWSEREFNDEGDHWEARIPGQPSGTKVEYYVEAYSSKGVRSLSPNYAPEQAHSFRVGTVGGGADPFLLLLHIGFMIGGMIVLVPGMAFALLFIRNDRGINFARTLKFAGIATGLLFVGGFPLGWIVAYQEFGTPWTGIPFGWDITDNKTLIIFAYWAIALFLVRDTLMKTLVHGKARFCPYKWMLLGAGKVSKGASRWLNKERKDSITKRGFVKLFLVGALLTIVVYLIPHSIRI